MLCPVSEKEDPMSDDLLRRYSLKEVPVHWVDICRVMRVMGLMNDFSKGECARVAAVLERQIKAGTARKLSRGVYAAVLGDHEAPIDLGACDEMINSKGN
jgi:hypothetical protein